MNSQVSSVSSMCVSASIIAMSVPPLNAFDTVFDEVGRRVSARPQSRVQDVSKRIAKQIHREHRRAQKKAWKDRHPRGGLDVLLRVSPQHRAPGRNVGRNSQAEEIEARLDD